MINSRNLIYTNILDLTESISGNVAFYPITQGPIELQNKLAQNMLIQSRIKMQSLRLEQIRLG